VAVADNVDTAEGENDLTPIRNLFNEWYSRDISKKKRISNQIKGNAGEPLGFAPYGYIKNPDNPKQWIIDEQAAEIVRRIYFEFLGKGTEQIAAGLEKDKILTPMHYWHSKGIKRPNRNGLSDKPYNWTASTVVHILTLQEYCGDLINFKTYSKDYRRKKRLKNSEENMAVFEDVHEPIINREDWERVQKKRSKTRKRKTTDGEVNMFSGLLVCADCKGRLNFHFNQGNHDIKYFNCANFNKRHKTCDQTHYVRVDFLEQVILQEVRRLTKFATQYEKEFAKAVMGHSKSTVENDRQGKQKELNALLARDKELDSLFNRMYEDNASGKIDDSRFARMSKAYTDEQTDIAEKMKTLRAELNKAEDKAVTSEMFISTVRKYTRARKLTPQMLNELIDKIEIHHTEKVDGENIQIITIYYACVGDIEIPDLSKIPNVDVTVNTRKGVNVTYSSTRKLA